MHSMKTGHFLLTAALILLLQPTPSQAKSYSFSVPQMKMSVHVEPDASVWVDYEILFENRVIARPLDAVDIGFFNKHFRHETIRASMDDTSLLSIGPSPYVKPGVEVILGQKAIPPGQRGLFRFRAQVDKMIYQDTTREDYASLRVTPTWFGSEFMVGSTDLRIDVHFPQGVDVEALLYHNTPFSSRRLVNNRAVASWHFPQARITGPNMIGVSFPNHVMSDIVVLTKWDLLLHWWEGSEDAQNISYALILAIILITFFALTGTSGISLLVFTILLSAWPVILYFLLMEFPAHHLYSWPFWLLFLFLGMKLRKKLKSRRKSYLPPIASVEGAGPKRGLTAPESAVVLEMPLGKVVTLVLFGLLKKGVISMCEDKPLKVSIDTTFEGDIPSRLKAGSARGIVLHSYEHAFIDALLEGATAPKETGTPNPSPIAKVMDIDFSDAVKKLIEHTAHRVEGYSLPDTVEHYKSRIESAWAMAEEIGEVELRNNAVDKNLEWLLLRNDSESRFRSWETRGYIYRPIWIRTPGAMYGGGTSGQVLGNVGSSPGIGMPSTTSTSFKDVAQSFAGWSENTIGKVADSTLGVKDPSKAGPAIDLSKFSNSSGSGGGGGGGCACAGCACACACAGGGR